MAWSAFFCSASFGFGGWGDVGLAVGVDLFGVEVFVVFVDLHLVHGGEVGVGGVGALAFGYLLDGAAIREERGGPARAAC